MSRRNIILTIICIGIIYGGWLLQAPKSFPPKKSVFSITKGTSLTTISDELYQKNYIKWPLGFKVLAKGISLGKGVQAGDYVFYEKENIFVLVHRLITGDQGQVRIKVTIPEGTNVADMAFIYLKSIPDFNAPLFVSLAKKEEGYLYPDTYYFLENVTPDEIVKTMRTNFNEKIKTLEKEISDFKKPLSDVIIMASIIEEETNNPDDRKIISGILWKRIKDGMPLQVDAPFYYITGKAGGFTYDDLKIKSPYNTYLNKGLPIGPISNPGIETIRDTIAPTETKYWFYLTGKDGLMHYATTYELHLLNRDKYIR